MNRIITRPPAPPLRHGQRLSRAEFERRYDAMPGLKKAELIEGVVYMPSPVTDDHAGPHTVLTAWLSLYWMQTPGVAARLDASVRLDVGSMPQPDIFLRIKETHGGQSYV